jgi:tRNA(Ile)-lysidine synthase
LLRLLEHPKGDIGVAVSGGPDSMAALDFLRKRKGNKTIALHVDHGTSFAPIGRECVELYCQTHGIELRTCTLIEAPPKGVSKEKWWAQRRYAFFRAQDDLGCIVTAHHLDDVVEDWITSCMKGTPALSPLKFDNFLRPFLLSTKEDLIHWCESHSVPYVHDPSNMMDEYTRNKVRNRVRPAIEEAFPGIQTTVRKLLLKQYKG